MQKIVKYVWKCDIIAKIYIFNKKRKEAKLVKILRINNTVIRYMFAIVFLLLALGFCGLSLFADGKGKEYEVITQISGETDYTKNDFYVEYEIVGRWEVDNTYITQYVITAVNNSDKDIESWEIIIDVPTVIEVDKNWNCNYSIDEDGMLKLTSNEYNKVISPKQEEVMGFKSTTALMYEPDIIHITIQKSHGMEDYSLYKILMIAAIVYVVLLVLYIVIQSRIEGYRQKNEENERIIVQALNTFANFVDAKDHYTQGHSARVAKYSKELARRMRLTKDVQQRIYYIALMHDVGKIAISEKILNKPERLTQEEINEMHTHTIKGADMLAGFTALSGITEGALYHHERYDGTGYPMKIAGENIPLYARIIGVADAYDVMSNGRCYRDALSKDVIIKELRDNAGTQFDPKIVKHMIDIIEDMDSLN